MTMLLVDNNHKYEILFGSDVINDGVYLEMNEIAEEIPSHTATVLFAFFSETDGRFTFHCFRQELPFSLVETFVQEARRRLFPTSAEGQGDDPAV